VTNTSLKDPLLRSTKTGETVSAVTAFHVAVLQHQELYEGLVPNQPPKHVSFTGYYRDDDDHYVLDTTAGSVRITSIDFEGELSINQTDVPFVGVLRIPEGREQGPGLTNRELRVCCQGTNRTGLGPARCRRWQPPAAAHLAAQKSLCNGVWSRVFGLNRTRG
jgi:hypothetical protein